MVKRTRNWSEYNKKLICRGRIDLWISDKVLRYKPKQNGKRGRHFTYADELIKACLIIKNVYQLRLRSTQGFVQSLFDTLGLKQKAPNYTTLCRRQKTLSIDMTQPSQLVGKTILIDSTGMKIIGPGEWYLRKSKITKRRTWRKVSIAVDADTLDIVSSVISDSGTQDFDRHVVASMLNDLPTAPDRVIADAAYDTFKCYDLVSSMGALAIFPPGKDARLSKYTRDEKKECSKEGIAQRDEHIRIIEEYGRKAWKEKVNYHRRSLVETAIFRLKHILSNRLRAKKIENQSLELQIRCFILNKMNAIKI